MPVFEVYTSANLERLFGKMSKFIAEEDRDIFVPQIIATQSKGMKRWLSLKLADCFGIAASYEFPFPNELIDLLFSSVLPEIPPKRFIEQGRDVWRLMRIIDENAGASEFQELKNYLGEPADKVKLYQLSAKLIDLFDQYITYRPDMITDWEKGNRADGWQSELWKKFRAAAEGFHPPEMKDKFTGALNNPGAGNLLPKKIFLFAIPVLPRFHVEALAAAAPHIDIKMFFLNPSPEYWFDIKSMPAISRALKRKPALTADELHLDEGNPLLSSMGRYGAEFLSHLNEIGIDTSDDSLFDEPRADTILSKIQKDIRTVQRAPIPSEKIKISGDMIRHDASLSFNSCHGKMRETEALKDFLLARFQNIPGLTPAEVIVMSPDIEEYAPYIHAVFGSHTSDHRIPYSIVDRKSADESPSVKGLLLLLALPEGRASAADISALLESDIIRESFSITEEELPEIKEWIYNSNIRWGLDAEDRSASGFPEFTANTWRFGLDRLMLGYAMESDREFNGVVSLGEGAANPDLLGRFTDFFNAVSSWIKTARRGHPPERWQIILNGLINAFFLSGDDYREELQQIILSLVHLKDAGEDDIPLRVISSHIKNSAGSVYTRGEFITGRLVFSSMLPMRSVPFRIICLLGMNDGAFPRKNRPPEFDLIAKNPMPGDRSISDEDRYLFLETIISARDSLYLSYTGRSAKDNSEISPSVLVSELMDYVDSCYEMRGTDSVSRTALLVEHRLQPFSPDYFSGEKNLFSYSEENLAASLRSSAVRALNPFFDKSSAAAAEPVRDISLNDLLFFFKNPAEYFLRNTLGIKIKERFFELEENEPFIIDGLTDFKLVSEFIDALIMGDDTSAIKRRALLEGSLPPGQAGARAVEGVLADAESFFYTHEKYLRAEKLPPIRGEAAIGDIKLRGELHSVSSMGLVDFRRSNLKSADLVSAWIKHLFLCSISGAAESSGLSSYLIRKDKFYVFNQCGAARGILSDIIRLYQKGLNEPLKFFPETSRDYFNNRAKHNAAETARTRYEIGLYNIEPESSDPAFSLAFRDIDPIDDEFAEIANLIFSPLFEFAAELKKGGDAEA